MLNARFMAYFYLFMIIYWLIKQLHCNWHESSVYTYQRNIAYKHVLWSIFVNSFREGFYIILCCRIIFTQINSFTSVGEFEIKLSPPVIEGKLICFCPIIDTIFYKLKVEQLIEHLNMLPKMHTEWPTNKQ